MLGAGDVMKQGTFKGIVCPNGPSEIPGVGPREALIAITTTAEEAVVKIKGIRDKER